jgi:hypothetical protein
LIDLCVLHRVLAFIEIYPSADGIDAVRFDVETSVGVSLVKMYQRTQCINVVMCRCCVGFVYGQGIDYYDQNNDAYYWHDESF